VRDLLSRRKESRVTVEGEKGHATEELRKEGELGYSGEGRRSKGE